MKSQTLVIDLVRNWLPSNDRGDYVHKALEYFDIAVVSYDADYPGMEKAEVKIIWDQLDPIDSERVELLKAVHLVTQQFEQAMGIGCTAVRHEGLMTYMSFKNRELVNVDNFDFLDLTISPKDPV